MGKPAKHTTTKARKQSAQVHFQKTGKNLTSKVGFVPVIKFLDKLGFGKIFKAEVDHTQKSNALYSLEDGVLLVLVGLIGGAFNLSKCVCLWSGCKVIRKVAGWISIPDETTLGRIFKKVKD